MKRVHIVGHKNHGKTTLIVDLVGALTMRGLRIGTIKHTSHEHELDIPGKDSYRHREAGAAVAGILSRSMSAVFWSTPDPSDSAAADRYEVFAPAFASCDVILVEGDLSATRPKIEVWRAELGSQPIAQVDPSVLALVTDEPLQIGIPILRRSDVSALADWIVENVRG